MLALILANRKLIGLGLGALAVCAALWFSYSWAYNRGVASQTAIVAAAKQTTQRALDANQSNETTITTLRAQNAACVASVAADKAAAQSASLSLIQFHQQATQAAQEAQHERTHIYATHPTAAAWRRVLVPAALVGSLHGPAHPPH